MIELQTRVSALPPREVSMTGGTVASALVRVLSRLGITLNHTRIQDRGHADRLREGWSGCFDRLKALLESA